MINQQNLARLTLKARLTLIFVFSIPYLSLLENRKNQNNDTELQIYKWCKDSFDEIRDWLNGLQVNGRNFHEKYIDQEELSNYKGYYTNTQKIELHAFNTCLHVIYYACWCMIKFDWQKDVKPQYKRFPSGVADIGGDTTFVSDFLEFIKQISNPEQIWQDQIITRLLQDHSTDDPEDFGENISRAYIEELLGEQLPF